MIGFGKGRPLAIFEHEGEGAGHEIFNLGKMSLSFGRQTEVRYSEVSLEYDIQLLKVSSDGEISNKEDADRYFHGAKEKIKDAIGEHTFKAVGPCARSSSVHRPRIR